MEKNIMLSTTKEKSYVFFIVLLFHFVFLRQSHYVAKLAKAVLKLIILSLVIPDKRAL